VAAAAISGFSAVLSHSGMAEAAARPIGDRHENDRSRLDGEIVGHGRMQIFAGSAGRHVRQKRKAI